MTPVFEIIALGFLTAVFALKPAGHFYVHNEGFFPRTHENTFITYSTELKSEKDDWEDKRINGWFDVKKKIMNLGFRLQSWKESGKTWLPRGPSMECKDLCKLTFSAKNFMKHFSGELIKDPCSLPAGNYTLTDYNFEEDLRDTVGDNMFYGHFKYTVTLTGRTEDESGQLQFNMTIWIKDLDLKKVNAKSGQGGKNKSSQNKGSKNSKKN